MSDPLDPTRPTDGQPPNSPYPGQPPAGPTQPPPGWTPQTPAWPSQAPGWYPPPGSYPPPQGWTPQPGWTPPPGGQYGYGGWQAPTKPRSRAPIVIGAVIVVVVVALVVGGLALLGSSLGTFMGGTPLNDLAVGQCFNGGRATGDGTTSIVNNVELVDCAEPHESELIATFDYAGPGGDAYPSEADLSAYSESECSTRFAQYVGVTFNASAFEMTYVYPLSSGWTFGDRSLQCIAHPPLGQTTMTGTVRDARR